MPHHGRSRSHSWLGWALEHSLTLPLGAVVALVWANVAGASYGPVSEALHVPVNDIGMVLFFGLAVREVVDALAPGGPLSSWRLAALPVVAAVGGMVGPAVIFTGLVHGLSRPDLARGWAIPCATDIAFSFLVARFIFGRRAAVPFLLLLAIADDALGLVILALFYPAGDLHLLLGGALATSACAGAWMLRQRGVSTQWPYLAGPGVLAWLGLHLGGLHPALALVLVVPFLPRERGTLEAFGRTWHLPVQVILLLFGFVNAGVVLSAAGTGTWAVLGAIVVGKPVGILLAVAVASATGLAHRGRMSWRDLTVVGVVAGIGFTVALFFATAAFPAGASLAETKLGALASLSAGAFAIVCARGLRVGRYALAHADAAAAEH